MALPLPEEDTETGLLAEGLKVLAVHLHDRVVRVLQHNLFRALVPKHLQDDLAQVREVEGAPGADLLLPQKVVKEALEAIPVDLHEDLDKGVEAVLEELPAVILLKAQWS